jgi:hypothetical protein
MRQLQIKNGHHALGAGGAMVGMRECTAMLNGHELSYLDSGDGPVVLFIRVRLFWSDVWR